MKYNIWLTFLPFLCWSLPPTTILLFVEVHFSSSAAIVGPPQNFTIEVFGTETLSFNWELPLDIDIDEIDYFVVDCNPTFQHDITGTVTDSLSVTLEEFLPGTTYTCTVAAKTDALGAPATATATTEEGIYNQFFDPILNFLNDLFCSF